VEALRSLEQLCGHTFHICSSQGMHAKARVGGLVSYIDYSTQDFPMNMLEHVVHKRRAFEHEREVRAVVISLPGNEGRPRRR